MCHALITWEELGEERGVLCFRFLLTESVDLLYNPLE